LLATSQLFPAFGGFRVRSGALMVGWGDRSKVLGNDPLKSLRFAPDQFLHPMRDSIEKLKGACGPAPADPIGSAP
jgi:hypothetical protein